VEKLANFKVDLCFKIDQVLIELKKLKKGTLMSYANSVLNYANSRRDLRIGRIRPFVFESNRESNRALRFEFESNIRIDSFQLQRILITKISN